MKIAKDIEILFEGDTKRLTEELLTGEISAGSRPLADYFTEAELQSLSKDILQHLIENKALSILMPVLSTMKWLSLPEACLYARKSRNTILELIKTAKIYGTKPGDSGEYIIDRDSIDAYYSEERIALQNKFKSLRRAS